MNAKQRAVLTVFGVLVFFCAALVVLGNFLGPTAGVELTNVGKEGLKTSIAALVGALSAMLGASK